MIITPLEHETPNEFSDPAELLIKEARQKARRRRLTIGSVLLGALVIVAVVLLVIGNRATAPQKTTASSVSSPSSCASFVSVKLGPQVTPATEELAYTLKLTNTEATSCTLGGYPTIRLMNAKQEVLPFTYVHRATSGYLMTKASPKNFTLKAHSSAYVLIAKTTCVGSDGERAATLSLTAGAIGSNVVTLSYPQIFLCVGSDPGNSVAVSPLEPSPQATM
jgi:hypothetical protein